MAAALYGTASRAIMKDFGHCWKNKERTNPMVKITPYLSAFAPLEDPKIAIAVYIENGRLGGRAAKVPALLMIEKYIQGEVKRLDLENYCGSWKTSFTDERERY